MVDIDGVDLAVRRPPPERRRASAARGLLPLDRRHTPLPFVHRRRSPACARRALRARLGERLGGEGQRTPAPPARPARGAAVPALLPRRSAPDGTNARALEARRDRRLRRRAAAGLDRRRLQRRLPRVGARRARRPTLLVQTEPAHGLTSREARAAGGVGAGAWRAGAGAGGAGDGAAGGLTAADARRAAGCRAPTRSRRGRAERAQPHPGARPVERRAVGERRHGQRPPSLRVGRALRRSSARSPASPFAAHAARLQRGSARRAIGVPSSSSSGTGRAVPRRRSAAGAALAPRRGRGAAGASASVARAVRGASRRTARADRRAARRRARRPDSRSSRRRGALRSAAATRARWRESGCRGARRVDPHRHPAPAAGTPCSESFHASSRSSALRAAGEIGVLMNEPSTATPVEARL